MKFAFAMAFLCLPAAAVAQEGLSAPYGAPEHQFASPPSGFRRACGIGERTMFLCVSNFGLGKGQHLLAHPKAAMLFHWKSLRRQVRVRGAVEPVTPAEADAYFASRARESRIGAWASERIRAGIQASLAHLGVEFDVWRSEGSLYTDGWVERAIERLRDGGWLEERDGALWFKSTAFGDDKDRVIRKSTGAFTYFGSDIGYVEEKFSRGFDHLIYVWGADHHGTVARVRNAAEAMGYPKESLEMLLVAWVRFIRDGEELSMSKRAGTFITLDELLAEIGVDSARWYFASRGATTPR